MKSFMKEFKEFAMKGNVMDLAVGVIIGAAFGKIVTSLVNDILMPLIGTLLGGNFETKVVTINGATIKYGMFIQAIVDFLIIALIIFILVKAMNKLKKPAVAETPAEAEEILLLREIRDSLKK